MAVHGSPEESDLLTCSTAFSFAVALTLQQAYVERLAALPCSVARRAAKPAPLLPSSHKPYFCWRRAAATSTCFKKRRACGAPMSSSTYSDHYSLTSYERPNIDV